MHLDSASTIPPRPGRLRSSAEFRRVRASGVRSRRDGVTAVVATGGPGPRRLGMSIGSHVGNAVVRNRLRRRLRVIFREIPLEPGTDVILSATQEAAGHDFQQLKTYVTQAVRAATAGGER